MSDNNTPNQETFFEFPCKFPIKVMADANHEVIEYITNVLEENIEDSENIEFKTKNSKSGNYISITATFEAKSKIQLDTIYRKISSHPNVRMVL